MKIQVRLYALFRERAGTRDAMVELPHGATVRSALDALARDYPGLAPVVDGADGRILFARNRAYVRADEALSDGDELALFPPVSGGSTSHGMLLLSGGFDSPVAAQWALSQGHRLDAVHFSMEPFTDDASVAKAALLSRILGIPRLTVVPIGTQLAEISKRCDARYYFVLQKRLMYRLAERLADAGSATFLLTGENLGQVSSQTLGNLGAIDAVARRAVVRPLLGLDKDEIIRTARQIGTYETSKGPEVCDVLGPKHPSTDVRLDRILREETKLDVDALVTAALAGAFEIDPVIGYQARAPAEACDPPRAA